MLKTLEKDKAKSLNTEHSQDFFRWIESCPEEYLLRYPTAIVACMVKMFSFHNIPEIKRMKGLLLKSLDRDTTLTEQERHDLLGDAEVSESFLGYNNISAISTHHRRACALLSRTSLSVDPKGAWTFSAPSIFMMYHRSVGGADSENAEMKECMPYYYQVSDGHGNGAEHGFAADLFYERGQLTDTDIANRMALSAAKRKNQFSVMLTCDFLSMRMALFNGDFDAVKKRGLDCQEWLRRERQYTLLNTLDMCQGFLYALLGCPSGNWKSPGWRHGQRQPHICGKRRGNLVDCKPEQRLCVQGMADRQRRQACPDGNHHPRPDGPGIVRPAGQITKTTLKQRRPLNCLRCCLSLATKFLVPHKRPFYLA